MAQLLLADLSALASESKRRSTDVKNASDAALNALRSDFDGTLAQCRGGSVNDGGRSGSGKMSVPGEAAPLTENVLLRPIALACQAKTHLKVTNLAVALLQRVVSMKSLPEGALAPLIDLLAPLVGKGDVDLLLKLLQTFSALLLAYPTIHDELLAHVLRLCFQLQSSRTQVVSSTAAATVRQAVMIVFEKVADEDRVLDGIKEGGEDAAVAAPLAVRTVDIMQNDRVTLFPSSNDAYMVLLDLNALAQDEAATFLGIPSLPQTFTLELIESILTNQPSLIRRHPELLHTLRRDTCPLLMKALSEKGSFPITVRYTRVLSVLLSQYSAELVLETEVLLSVLLRFIQSTEEVTPSWQRLIALEAIRSLCSDVICLRNISKAADGSQHAGPVFVRLVITLRDILKESHPLVGGTDSTMSPPASGRPSLDRGTTAAFGLFGAAAGAASAMLGVGNGQDTASSTLTLTAAPPVQLIDQLEKADAPNVPELYPFLLAIQSLLSIAQSLAQNVLPAFSDFVSGRDGSRRLAPPHLTFSDLSIEQREDLEQCKSMAETISSPLRSAFFFVLKAKTDAGLYCETLTAVRNWTNVCGVLGIEEARNRFIASLSSLVVRSGRTDTDASRQDRIDETALSERSMAALRLLLHVVIYLSGMLGTNWRPILATLSQAEVQLRESGRRRTNTTDPASGDINEAVGKSASSPSLPAGFPMSSTSIDSRTGKPQLFANLDVDTVLKELRKCYQNSAALKDDAFRHFLGSLCDLCRSTLVFESEKSDFASSTASGAEEQETSSQLERSKGGVHDFVGAVILSNLDVVLRLNTNRLGEPNALEAWDNAVSTLLSAASSGAGSGRVRAHAAEVLAQLLSSAMDAAFVSETLDAKRADTAEGRVWAPLRTLSILGNSRSTAGLEVRRIGVLMLQSIVAQHGHRIRSGWSTLFEATSASCSQPKSQRENSNLDAAASDRASQALVKAAFTAVHTTCQNFLPRLDPANLRFCIETLEKFTAAEDLNVALTASSLLWNVTADLSLRSSEGVGSPDAAKGTENTDLWLRLLCVFRVTAFDSRSDVRDAAISGLFRVLASYNTALDAVAWGQTLNTVILPLLQGIGYRVAQVKSKVTASAAAASASANAGRSRRTSSLSRPGFSQQLSLVTDLQQWEQSRVVAFDKLGPTIAQYLCGKLVKAPDFAAHWNSLLAEVKNAFLDGPAPVSQAAAIAFTTMAAVDAAFTESTICDAWRDLWLCWANIAGQIASKESELSQANLLVFLEAFEALYRGQLQPIELEAVSAIQRVTLYSKSKDLVSDRDLMSPVQAATRRILLNLKPQPGLQSSLLLTMAERISLPFSATAATPTKPDSQTFIGVHKAAVQDAVALVRKNEAELDIYTSGAVSAVLSALAIPIKLRYDCPSPSSGTQTQAGPSAGHERELWQEATLASCRILRCVSRLLHGARAAELAEEQLNDLWSHVATFYEAIADADCSSLPSGSSCSIEDESYDVLVLSEFQKQLLPVVGNERVSPSVIERLGACFARSSEFHRATSTTRTERSGAGSVVLPSSSPRELFAVYSLDLLVLICSDRLQNDHHEERRRVSSLIFPALLNRLKRTLIDYVANGLLRGGMPFPRTWDEEAYAVLSHALDLRLMPGVPSKSNGTSNDQNAPSSIRALALQSPRAHLFLLHAPLVDIVGLAGKSPALSSSTTSAAPVSSPNARFCDFSTPDPDGQLAFDGLIGHRNVLGSTRLDLDEPRRIQDLAQACLAKVSEVFQ
ncbi:unnamed protein product [Jaminaea pallidilutea]